MASLVLDLIFRAVHFVALIFYERKVHIEWTWKIKRRRQDDGATTSQEMVVMEQRRGRIGDLGDNSENNTIGHTHNKETHRWACETMDLEAQKENAYSGQNYEGKAIEVVVAGADIPASL